MIEKYIQTLKEHALADPSAVPVEESVLGILYECHNENHGLCVSADLYQNAGQLL